MVYGCFVFSLSDLPSVTSSEMSQKLQVLMEEADEYDNIHDIVIRVW